MNRHRVLAHTGFGNTGTLPELHRCLAWYERRPNFAATARGAQRMTALRRDIAALESQPSTVSTIKN